MRDVHEFRISPVWMSCTWQFSALWFFIRSRLSWRTGASVQSCRYIKRSWITFLLRLWMVLWPAVIAEGIRACAFTLTTLADTLRSGLRTSGRRSWCVRSAGRWVCPCAPLVRSWSPIRLSRTCSCVYGGVRSRSVWRHRMRIRPHLHTHTAPHCFRCGMCISRLACLIYKSLEIWTPVHQLWLL